MERENEESPVVCKICGFEFNFTKVRVKYNERHFAGAVLVKLVFLCFRDVLTSKNWKIERIKFHSSLQKKIGEDRSLTPLSPTRDFTN